MNNLIIILVMIFSFKFFSIQSIPVSNTEKFLKNNPNITDEKHGIRMGQVLPECDDAKTDLDIDWNGSPINYTCYHRIPYGIDTGIDSIVECEKLSSDYMPQHFCIKDRIDYSNHSSLPTYGDHRPLWPIFGEYRFIPPQRWLHNVEHGAIIMIYHPCAHPMMVDKLRKLVRNCIRKHVITPDSYRLDHKRPLALIAWGCRLRMNYVDSHEIVNFIRKHALHGPEGKLPKEGQYDAHLLRKAMVPIGSNFDDDILCPFSFR
ncbi:hypothetical protein DERF_014096 [Dermatophagoides farinae]|uniref:Uncharacterized protein n=1 Tax=Dermatophagoides farinae TaxID=6954 RepID=A0A922HGT4_DERFA|nr:hypothetical protein DERF_014096 [Dermatophagoides farinae]